MSRFFVFTMVPLYHHGGLRAGDVHRVHAHVGQEEADAFLQLECRALKRRVRGLSGVPFLRRIRHKIAIGTPDKGLFTEIFQLACRQRGIPFNQEALDYLYSAYYDKGKPPRSSDPRDLLEIVQSICRFRNQEVALTENLIAEAALKFFCQI